MKMRIAILAAFLAGPAVTAAFAGDVQAGGANAATQKAGGVSVFDAPSHQRELVELRRGMVRAFQAERYEQAARLGRRLVQRMPHRPNAHYNLACALARQGRHDAAMAALRRAVEAGFAGVEKLRTDPDLKAVRHGQAFADLLNAAQKHADQQPAGVPFGVSAASTADGTARITEANTRWDLRRGLFRVFFEPEPPAPKPPVMKGQSQLAKRLSAWFEQDTAAGHRGDLYDNRDRGHSRLNPRQFPQLARTAYSNAAQNRGLHTGLQLHALFNRVTLGNASMASKGKLWRSLGRAALTLRSRGPALLFHQYVNHHLYIYPEHKDHDPERGDLFPANTPYMLISQGSSGSDKPFLRAIAATLAAFRPDVKQHLVENHLLMPTVQRVLRRSLKGVHSESDYMTGRAHPTAFDNSRLDAVRMAERAHHLRKADILPVAAIEVVDESLGEAGVDYFAPENREKLFTTPAAVARIHRSVAREKRMVLRARAFGPAGDEGLRFRWAVLRGDVERITVEKLREDGSKVELRVPYHGRRPVREGAELRTNRVDIGVFAQRGQRLSAPSFVSIHTIPTQKRVYDERGRIRSVDYDAKGHRDRYADPVYYARRGWRDEYRWTEGGELVGWTRHREGAEPQRFTRHGARVIEADERGRALRARTVRYEQTGGPGSPKLVQNPGDELLVYRYDGPEDRLGQVAERREIAER